MMISTTHENSTVIANLSDAEDIASNQKDKWDSLTPASSVMSSPDVTAGKRGPVSQASPTPPRLGIELSELFTENVVAKIWRVAVRELNKQVHPQIPCSIHQLTLSRILQPTIRNTSPLQDQRQTTTPSAKPNSGHAVSFQGACTHCSSGA